MPRTEDADVHEPARGDGRAIEGAIGGDLPDSTARPIRRLLVANRGELVVRIGRTARSLGIRTLALVPADQADSWWAGQVDEAVPFAGSYLDARAVVEAARGSGTDAVHPGYGFLAEDASFAELVLEAGIRWVGPPPTAMRMLGDKAAARRVAGEAGVPVLPGYDGEGQTDDELAREADRIGYPVLLKPSAGGGGKGMHVVRSAERLLELVTRARREAAGAFGDDRLVLERFVEGVRHVEVQLLADEHGTVVHLGERDCSLQRRHQKVIEEAPSPAVSEELRRRLGDAAVRLAVRAGYVGAGTAEFLLDEHGDLRFLELNARLQVEHPVTELVTGRDLVADQLRIAAGEPLGFDQADVRMGGRAIEARLYAEDPWAGFVPATGRIHDVEWPEGEGVRVDTGVGAGDVVGTRYDPMLAKIIAVAASRDEALRRLRDALDGTAVFGVTTNRGFLRSLITSGPLVEGDARTDTIERAWHPDGAPSPSDRLFETAATVLAATSGPDGASPPRGFRLNARPRLRVAARGEERSLEVAAATSPGLRHRVVDGPEGRTVHFDLDGLAVAAALAPAPTIEEAMAHAAREGGAAQVLSAPMPGVVLSVSIQEGQVVEAGQVMLVLEAMKMENTVAAPAAATVLRVLASAGQQVQRGQPLVELA